jgi:predicted ABC-type ATPase
MFLGGGSASGKSDLAGAPDSARIDADAIKAQLPEYQQMLKAGDPRAASFTHEESSDVARQAMTAATAGKINYTLDGTGDSQYDKLAGKVAAARGRGYRVHAQYVTADIPAAIARATERAKKTGRMVPPQIITSIHAAVSAAYERAAREGLFDGSELFDTNGPKPRLIARTAGPDLHVLDAAAWHRFLDKKNAVPPGAIR